MKYSQFISLFLLFLVSSCSIFVDEYQTNQKKVIEFLLSDLPIPEDSSIMRGKEKEGEWTYWERGGKRWLKFDYGDGLEKVTLGEIEEVVRLNISRLCSN